MNKITLAGFAADRAPKWVATKSKNAWGHAGLIAERRAMGATLQELADEYGVSMPTISRIEKSVSITAKQDSVIKELRAELTLARMQRDAAKADLKAEVERNSEAVDLSDTNLEALRDDLRKTKVSEQALYERLLDDDQWARRWENEYLQAKADLEAAEAQITHMAERLAECRNRGFWARVFNR